MMLIIEKHKSGYTVRTQGFPCESNTLLCGATTVDEALAFIRSRMEPEGEGESPDDKRKATLRQVADLAKEIGWHGTAISAELELAGIPLRRSDVETPAAAPEKPLDKLQRLGQEYDATPTDPPWKRAKVGDWVKIGKQIHVWQIEEFYQTETGLEMVALKHSNPRNGGHVTARKRIVEILPTPPRHGDFGSRPEEDGA